MNRWFQFSLRWAIAGAVFGLSLGIAICWFSETDRAHWATVAIVFATLFGALGSFFGVEMVKLVFEVLSHLLP